MPFSPGMPMTWPAWSPPCRRTTGVFFRAGTVPAGAAVQVGNEVPPPTVPPVPVAPPSPPTMPPVPVSPPPPPVSLFEPHARPVPPASAAMSTAIGQWDDFFAGDMTTSPRPWPRYVQGFREPREVGHPRRWAQGLLRSPGVAR